MTTATATPKLTLAEQAAAAEHKRIVNSLEVYRKLAQAAAAGDMKQVRICDRALDGRKSAIAKCAAVIAAAKG